MELSDYLIAALIAAPIGGALLLANHLDRRRREQRRRQMAELADEFGWSFHRHGGALLKRRVPQFARFASGTRQNDHNVMRGELLLTTNDGEPIHLFTQAGDYTVTTVSGSGERRRESSTHFSYLLVTTPEGRKADLRVRPEGVADRVKSAVGLDDIDFESAEFSRRYHVASRDRRFAYDVLHPRAIELLLEPGTPRFEIAGGVLLLSSRRKRWRPDEFRAARDWATRFFALWPRHVMSAPDSLPALQD